MSLFDSWKSSYPAALRDYRLDEDALSEPLDETAGRCSAQFAKSPAFTLVLPSGLTASLDFGQVDSHADDFAAFLYGVLGLAVGDVVAIQLPNSLHYPVAVFGAWRAGLVVTNVNPLYTERELREQLLDSGAKVLWRTARSWALPPRLHWNAVFGSSSSGFGSSLRRRLPTPSEPS